jgi:hypothetical protein
MSKKYQAIGDYIVLKLFVKKSAGIIVPTNMEHSTLKDTKRFENIAEVWSVGGNVKLVKRGDKIYNVQRGYAEIPIPEITGIKKDENVVYVKAKEEDIMAIIT